MTQPAAPALYSRDFGNRPLLVLGGAIVVAALVTALAFTTGVVFIVAAAVLILAAGIAGFLTATTRLEVAPTRVVCRSRLRERSYDASELELARRSASNIFVLAPREHGRKVVCTFSDEDVDHVEEVFATAGVSIAPPESAQPKGDDAG